MKQFAFGGDAIDNPKPKVTLYPTVADAINAGVPEHIAQSRTYRGYRANLKESIEIVLAGRDIREPE